MSFEVIVLGGGRMGRAVADGLRRARPDVSLLVVQRGREKAEDLTAHLAPVPVETEIRAEHVGENTSVILCVKPDHAEAALRGVARFGVRRVLSVVAGLVSARLEAALPDGAAVVRAMPNTPAAIGAGVSAMSGGAYCTAADLEWAEGVLGALGTVVRVPESKLDAVSALSGAMPAYVYLVVEALVEAGVHQGLSREVSAQLVGDTLSGSAELLRRSGESPEALRHAVTSPGGLTAAGLRILESRAVRSAFLEAVAAAAERSRQLGR